MPTEISITTPPEFDFLTTVRSHGWYDLDPFYFDETAGDNRRKWEAYRSSFQCRGSDRKTGKGREAYPASR